MEWIVAGIVVALLAAIFVQVTGLRHDLRWGIRLQVDAAVKELAAIREAAIDVQAAVKKAEGEVR